MTFTKIPAALCVTLVMVSLMAGSVTGLSLWSRLLQKLNLYDDMDDDRPIPMQADHHPMNVQGDHHLMDMQGEHHPMDMHDLHDSKHGIKMGIPNQECDDGKNGISTDWDPNDHTVYECKSGELESLMTDSEPEQFYNKSATPVQHVCLNESIPYPTTIPTSGNHRPLWPKFGEYDYLPPQRWVHSLEHGAVAFLYHPCKNGTNELKKLKLLLKHCLTKYVTTPYRLIPNNMPFAFLAFENALLISKTAVEDLPVVTKFIRDYALKGQETHVLKDGQYTAGKKLGVIRVTNNLTCHDDFLHHIKTIFENEGDLHGVL